MNKLTPDEILFLILLFFVLSVVASVMYAFLLLITL